MHGEYKMPGGKLVVIDLDLGGNRGRRAPCPATRSRRMMRTVWRDHDWQLIHAVPQSPTLHLALDDVLTHEVGAGRRCASGNGLHRPW
jgi:hypothetical protein